jgi:hypothetical protein
LPPLSVINNLETVDSDQEMCAGQMQMHHFRDGTGESVDFKGSWNQSSADANYITAICYVAREN